MLDKKGAITSLLIFTIFALIPSGPVALFMSLLEPGKVNTVENFSGPYQTCTNVHFRCSGVCFARLYKLK